MEIREIVAKINSIGLIEDAQRAAAGYSDMGGLIYIANMAMGNTGTTSMKLFTAIDLADYINLASDTATEEFVSACEHSFM